MFKTIKKKKITNQEKEPRFATFLANYIINEESEDSDNIQIIEPNTKASSTYKDFFIENSMNQSKNQQLLKLLKECTHFL